MRDRLEVEGRAYSPNLDSGTCSDCARERCIFCTSLKGSVALFSEEWKECSIILSPLTIILLHWVSMGKVFPGKSSAVLG